MSTTTIRITWVPLTERYRIDEVTGDGLVRTEISPAVVDNKAFAEHLAALVADYRQLNVSHGAIDDEGVVLERERCRPRQQRASGRGFLGTASTTRSPQLGRGGLEQRRARS